MLQEPLEFTVDRKTWAVGYTSKLRIADNAYTNPSKMCCLGFYIDQLADGTDRTLTDFDTPASFCTNMGYDNDSVPDALRRLVRFDWHESNGVNEYFWNDVPLTDELMNINDKASRLFEHPINTREDLLIHRSYNNVHWRISRRIKGGV